MDVCGVESALEQYQHLITGCVRRNLPLIMALQLEIEDVIQDLSLRLLQSVDRYDATRCRSLSLFLYHELQYEVLNMKKRHKPHGIVGVPRDLRLNIVYLDQPNDEGKPFDLPVEVNFDDCIDDVIGILPEEERSVIVRKMNGEPIRKKVEREQLARARSLLSDYFVERKYEYA